MAPEQFRNAKGVDARGDVYSVAATLYAMVTGVIPFDNTSPLDCWLKKMRGEFPPPRDLNPAVSERVSWAICRAMHQDPGERPASCREFVEDLTGQNRPSVSPALTPPSSGSDRWYMAYKDETGKQHTVKGQTDGIRKALREGYLGDAQTVVVSRSKSGPFVPLHSVAEFRDLVASPTPVAVSAPAARIPGEIPAEPPEPLPPFPGLEDTGTGPKAAPRAAGRTPGRSGGSAEYGRQAVSLTPPDGVDADTRAGAVTRTPVPAPRTSAGAGGREKFDWTPVLAVLVMVLSAVVGYLLFSRNQGQP
jgi:serine/threonine protein kinase